MAQNQVKSLGSHGRQDCFFFDPFELTLPEDDPDRPGDDGRPQTVAETFVRDIMHKGIHTPIRIARAGTRQDGSTIKVVVAGRKRVRAARIANQRFAEMGKELLRVPAMILRGDAGDLFGVTVSENEQREQSTPLVRARQLERYLAFGKTQEEARVTFGISASTLRNYQALLECCPEVQQAIDQGFSADAAITLSRLSHEEQRKALAEMVAAGATKGAKAKEAVEQAAKGNKAEPQTTGRKRSRRFLTKAIEVLDEVEDDDAKVCSAMIRYMMGDDRALRRLPESVRSALRAIARERKAKEKP